MATKDFEANDNWFGKLTSKLDENLKGVRLGICSVALCGLCVALRSVRPFAKFHKPSQIPSSFYKQQIKLNGKVVGVEASEKKSVLLVDHAPIFCARLRKEKKLPVEIEGVDVTGNGFSWLQTIVKNNEIEFVLLKPYKQSVGCLVFFENYNLGNKLVSLGLASVAPYNMSLDENKMFRKYYKSLLKDEAKAEKKKVGMWWDGKASYMYDFIVTRSKRLTSNLPKMLKINV